MHLGKTANHSGFTLVEVALVLIVAGFIIAMAVQAVELVQISRVKATATQIKTIESATKGFWDKYNALPGDLPNPTNFLANCNAAPCNQPGDNVIVPTIPGGLTGRASLNNAPADDPTGREGEAFFVQLRVSDFYAGTDPAQGAVWGGFYPETPIPNSGITAGSYVQNPGASFGGTIVSNANLPFGLYLSVQGGTPAAQTQEIVASYLGMIDRALDDGTPDRGIMRGRTPGGAAACEVAGPPILYAGEDGRCGFFIFIGDYTRDIGP